MNIERREYTDGFFKLSTYIKGQEFSLLYSSKTNTNDAISDFMSEADKELHRRMSCMPSNLPCNGFPDDR